MSESEREREKGGERERERERGGRGGERVLSFGKDNIYVLLIIIYIWCCH